MIRARFDPLDDSDKVFRLVEVGSSFLPEGARVPGPSWFEPSSADKAEGAARGRAPGLSVWDSGLTKIEQAIAIRGRGAPSRPAVVKAFELEVGCVRKHGASQAMRALDVVADPLDPAELGEGAEGHAVMEGLARPPGMPRAEHLRFLDALVGLCQERSA